MSCSMRAKAGASYGAQAVRLALAARSRPPENCGAIWSGGDSAWVRPCASMREVRRMLRCKFTGRPVCNVSIDLARTGDWR